METALYLALQGSTRILSSGFVRHALMIATPAMDKGIAFPVTLLLTKGL